MTDESYDIVVAGGGLVGNSLALALANSSLRIAVVEAIDYEQRQEYDDNRAIGLSYTSERILQKLGVWPHIEDKAHPIDSIHISMQGRFGVARILATEQGLPSLGCNIDIQYLQKNLAQSVRAEETLRLYAPYQLTACERVAGQWRLTLSNGEVQKNISARLLVAADGSDSWIRRSVGIHAQVWDYEQSAVVSHLTFNKALNHKAYERFTPSGLMAVLPTGDKTATFIWSTAHDDAKQLQSMSEENLLQQLQQAWGYRLGRLLTASTPVIYPLKRIHANEVYREGLVLIGNAAQTLHPVAAQGFNLGLRSAMMLAEVLRWSQTVGRDYAETAILEEYAQQQAADRTQIARFTHFLVNRFAVESEFFKQWQPLALGGLEWIPGAKSVLARLGLGGAQKALWV